MTEPAVRNNILDSIKKKQIIDEICKTNATIPAALLEIIWDSVKLLDEKKLKQLRKGTYKIKNPIKRKEYKDGEIIKGCCEITPPFKNIVEVEEYDENKIQQLIISDV